MRDTILQNIKRLAVANGGQPPSKDLFASETGITEQQWMNRYWTRWGEALAEAGYPLNSANEKFDPGAVLHGLARAVRHYGHLPTAAEIWLYRKSDPTIPTGTTIRRHLGKRQDMLDALAERAAEDPDFADIAPLLPKKIRKPVNPRLPLRPDEGAVYLVKSGDFYRIGRIDSDALPGNSGAVPLSGKEELFHSILTDDPPGIEAYWLRRFAKRRADGEWFRLDPQDVAAFRRRKFQ